MNCALPLSALTVCCGLAALAQASSQQQTEPGNPLEAYKREVAALAANPPKGEFVQSDGVGLGYRVVELWAIVRKAPGPVGTGGEQWYSTEATRLPHEIFNAP
jgi:hypothetical protein